MIIFLAAEAKLQRQQAAAQEEIRTTRGYVDSEGPDRTQARRRIPSHATRRRLLAKPASY